MKKLTHKRADRLLREWQRRLGLSDWTIRLSVKGLPGNWGTMNALVEKKQAIVRIDPSTHAKDSVKDWPWQSADHERTIIHELLHCHTQQLCKPESGLAEEQVVHALSHALVTLKRRKR